MIGFERGHMLTHKIHNLTHCLMMPLDFSDFLPSWNRLFLKKVSKHDFNISREEMTAIGVPTLINLYHLKVAADF